VDNHQQENIMELMFVVLYLPTMARLAAFASYDDAVEFGNWYCRTANLDMGECLIEAVEEDEDLFYTINR
jgi:hypothetical protein